MLNGRPYPLRLVLDQGYWPDSGLTAPDDDALRRDVELAKAMGFNGVRKHQKIEDPRYLYWADRLGLLVWEEMPSAYRFTPSAIERLMREWTEVIERDYSHPCIIAWVPFNESWGVPDLPDVPAQRHCVQALYHLTHTLDPTRPVIGNDGWESVATDIVGIHDYDADPERMAQRYRNQPTSASGVQKLFSSERPGTHPCCWRVFASARPAHHADRVRRNRVFEGSAAHLGIFAGQICGRLCSAYAALLEAVRSLPMFAGFCYTQFTDTYQEANGLLYMDRTPKFPIEQIAVATRGPRTRPSMRSRCAGERNSCASSNNNIQWCPLPVERCLRWRRISSRRIASSFMSPGR